MSARRDWGALLDRVLGPKPETRPPESARPRPEPAVPRLPEPPPSTRRVAVAGIGPASPKVVPFPRRPGERAKSSALPPLLPSPLWEPPPRPPGLDPAIWDEMLESARFGRVRIELWGGQRVAIFDPVPGGRWWEVLSSDFAAIELAEEALERLALLAEQGGEGGGP